MSNCTNNDCIRIKNARRYLQHQTILNKKYYTRNEEYLKGRERTHRQNQFAFLVSGNNKFHSGAPLTNNNVYRNTINKINCDNVENSPSNFKYGVQGAVSNDLRIMELKRHLYKR
tara:strand:- start:240 stop:584 length:345 start_codon:yes stop_codon:yes gene_type:complete